MSKGLVPPLGTLPSAYVAERVQRVGGRRARRPVARRRRAQRRRLAGRRRDATPPSAARSPTRSAPPASTRATPRDVVGIELAGCAKNAAALAAAAASPAGPNASGAAAGKVFAEVDALARHEGSQPETFAGLAGTGDLVATVLADGSRNRRAGELLASGMPADDIDPRSATPPRASPACRCCASALDDAGVDAPALRGLAGVIEGDVEAASWTESLTAPRPAPSGARRSGGVASHAWPRHRTRPSAAKAQLDAEFSELYKAHLRDVYSYSYYRVGNHHDAEDLTEQTFLQAYRHFERAQRESQGRPLRPWLIRIAHNLAANYYRDRSRKPQTPIDDAGTISAPHTTEALVEDRDDLERILEGVQQLPDDRREALIMRFALGMDNREIARALGRTDGATKVLLHRAIRQLEEIVQKAEGPTG